MLYATELITSPIPTGEKESMGIADGEVHEGLKHGIIAVPMARFSGGW